MGRDGLKKGRGLDALLPGATQGSPAPVQLVLPPPSYVRELRAAGVSRFKCGIIEIEFGKSLAEQVAPTQLQINEILKASQAGMRAMRDLDKPAAGPLIDDDTGEELEELSTEEQAAAAEAEKRDYDKTLFHSAE